MFVVCILRASTFPSGRKRIYLLSFSGLYEFFKNSDRPESRNESLEIPTYSNGFTRLHLSICLFSR